LSEEADALREMAANRGCRLVRSRRRKPGGDFGRYGLKDARTGKEILGFGSKGLAATASEIEDYLRGGAAANWKSSLGAASKAKPVPEPRKRDKTAVPGAKQARSTETKRARVAPPPSAARPVKAGKARPPAPPPEPMIREARPKDAATIAGLIAELGYETSEADVRRRLTQLRKAGEPALVADLEGVVGILTWHVTPVLHRPRPVGRITMMAVAAGARGKGIGAALLAAAEARLNERGCGLVEVTSNMKRLRAHGFYGRAGYERTSYRFMKPLD
jgi:ribosomal protein S18 acetylase RimI-like enzyme